MIYSWTDEPLIDHSLETLDEAKRFYLKEFLVARKYAELATNGKSIFGEKILYLAVALHDIGKGISKYQEQFNRGLNRDPTFKFHESYSTYIFADIATSIARDSLADRVLAIGGALAIALHHHAMMRLKKGADYRILTREVGEYVELPSETLDIICEVASTLHIDMKKSLISRNINSIDVANLYSDILGIKSRKTELFRNYLKDEYRLDTYQVAECILAPLVRADRKVSSNRKHVQD